MHLLHVLYLHVQVERELYWTMDIGTVNKVDKDWSDGPVPLFSKGAGLPHYKSRVCSTWFLCLCYHCLYNMDNKLFCTVMKQSTWGTGRYADDYVTWYCTKDHAQASRLLVGGARVACTVLLCICACPYV